MRIRQMALVAEQLQPIVDDLCAVFGIEVGFNDPGVGAFGLENAVIPIGDTFLEVVVPKEEGTTAGRLLEKRGGDGGYMVILQTEDLAAERKRMDELGVRIVWEFDGEDASTIHLHPKDIGGAIVSLDVMRPPEHWRWGGPDWKSKVKTDVVKEIVGAELQCGDPGAMAARWAEVLGRSVAGDGKDGPHIDLEQGVIRFVPETDGRGDGVSGMDLRVVDKERVLAAARAKGYATTEASVRMCGVVLNLV